MTASTFPCILADPPWPFADQGSRITPEYDRMPLAQIIDLGAFVRPLLADDAFLWLWIPNSLVLDGVARRVCRAWGAEPKQLIPWVKTDSKGKPRLGGGHYTRVVTEQLVLARRGRPEVLARNVPGVIHAQRGTHDGKRGAHSAKPDASYELIESLCAGPRLELFARRRYSPEWAIWGAEVESDLELMA